MRTLVLAAVTVLLLGVLAVLLLRLRARSARMRRCIAAAHSIVQEDYLEYCLSNPANGGALKPAARRQMLCLRALGVRPPMEYVFDPAKGITMGREREQNSVYLNEATVSLRHCRIFAQGSGVWLQDLMADNGTGLQRGLRRYRLANGSALQLRNGDVLQVGSSRLKVELFMYDVALM